MRLNAIHHVAIIVSDYARAAPFMWKSWAFR